MSILGFSIVGILKMISIFILGPPVRHLPPPLMLFEVTGISPFRLCWNTWNFLLFADASHCLTTAKSTLSEGHNFFLENQSKFLYISTLIFTKLTIVYNLLLPLVLIVQYSFNLSIMVQFLNNLHYLIKGIVNIFGISRGFI